MLQTVCSYLPIESVLKFRVQSKKSRDILIDSGIASIGKTYEIKYAYDTPCLLTDNVLEEKLKEKKAILELVSEVRIEVNYSGNGKHRLDE